MDVVLDESSLIPCTGAGPAQRIQTLASTLKALDRLGCARALRSVRDAADLDIGEGRGLRGWCFDRSTDRDAGRFVAQRLGKQPFIDGTGGLLGVIEGSRLIEGRYEGKFVAGLTYAALTTSPAVAVRDEVVPIGTELAIEIITLDEEGEFREMAPVHRLVTEEHVLQRGGFIRSAIESALDNGQTLLMQSQDIFPRLRFGPKALQQIDQLSGNEPVFLQLIRHLRALDQGAAAWLPDMAFSPAEAIAWSRESNATLAHGSYGPMRDFPMPEGYPQLRWSNHTKLSGGVAARLYFHAERFEDGAVVLIGYFGEHLPTVRYD